MRDLFGIVRKYDECRQFRKAYIELPKKNGKSELAAAIALLLTITDLEFGGEIYGCATTGEQASLVFDVAVNMVDKMPALKRHIKLNFNNKKMIFKPLNSFYKVLSADSKNKDGYDVHGVISMNFMPRETAVCSM